jgi:prepilin-type N-terminal cleavage/methylation domain-containing protein
MQVTKINNQKGFTIIELLVSMVAFSSMLLIVGITTMQLGRMYYKGVSTAKTQEVSRVIMAAVSEQAQFATGPISSKTQNTISSSPTTPVNSYCIGDARFTYITDRALNNDVVYDETNKQIKHVLWQDKDDTASCDPVDLSQDLPSAEGKELMGDNMRISNFTVDASSSLDMVSIKIGVIYGDKDLIEGTAPDIKCKTGDIGAQWCATSSVETQVFRRFPR